MLSELAQLFEGLALFLRLLERFLFIVNQLQFYWNLDPSPDFAGHFIDLDDFIGNFMNLNNFDWNLDNMAHILILFSEAHRSLLIDDVQVFKGRRGSFLDRKGVSGVQLANNFRR